MLFRFTSQKRIEWFWPPLPPSPRWRDFWKESSPYSHETAPTVSPCCPFSLTLQLKLVGFLPSSLTSTAFAQVTGASVSPESVGSLGITLPDFSPALDTVGHTFLWWPFWFRIFPVVFHITSCSSLSSMSSACGVWLLNLGIHKASF